MSTPFVKPLDRKDKLVKKAMEDENMNEFNLIKKILVAFMVFPILIITSVFAIPFFKVCQWAGCGENLAALTAQVGEAVRDRIKKI